MSDLPEGWVVTSLGEITSLRGEKIDPAKLPDASFIGLEDIAPHTSAILKVGKAADVRSAVARFASGDVLYSRLRPYLNKVTVPDFDGVASAEILVLQPLPATNAEFVRRKIMTGEFLDFTAMLDKGDRPRVNYKEIATFPVALPPLPEQRRIVAKVDALTARTARARVDLSRIPTLIARYKQRLLALAFSGELTAGWRAANDVPPAQFMPVSKLCRTITDGDHQAPPRADEGVPFITISAINDGEIDLAKANRRVPQSYFDGLKESRRATTGDVLFSVTGSIGIAALVKNDVPFVFQRHIAILKPDPQHTSGAFLRFMLESPDVKAQCLAIATGTAQLTIPLGGLRNFSVPLPVKAEQAEIVRRVESAFGWLDRMAADHAAAARLIPKLDAAILAKAFRGDLVPQDPNDEPASVLLERIRAEREAFSIPRRGRRSAFIDVRPCPLADCRGVMRGD